jgi:hypothetical protein
MTSKTYFKIPNRNTLLMDVYPIYDNIIKNEFSIITICIDNVPQIVVDFCNEDNIHSKFLILIDYIMTKITGRRNIDISFTI